MRPEEENPNHFRNITIEQLQWQLNIIEEANLPNKEEYKKKIIQKFLEEFKDNELINLNTVEEVEAELRKLVARQRAEDDGR